MMEMEDKLEVLGDSSPQQTHLSERWEAIEFSNICLHSTTDATSTDPINHRNELFRTYRGLMLQDIAAKAFTHVGISSLNAHRGTWTLKSKLSWQNSSKADHQKTFHCTSVLLRMIYLYCNQRERHYFPRSALLVLNAKTLLGHAARLGTWPLVCHVTEFGMRWIIEMTF